MKVLVLNCGSSTLKFQVIETGAGASYSAGDRTLARGLVDRIGGDSTCTFEVAGATPEKRTVPIRDHEAAVRETIEWLNSNAHLRDFEVVGHRVVHGGGQITFAVLIYDVFISGLEKIIEVG